jgi:tetratricopeptide (TPR) repeat protein
MISSKNIHKIFLTALVISSGCLTTVLCQESVSAIPDKQNLVAKGYEQIGKGQFDLAVKTLCQAVQADRNAIVPRRYLAYALTRAGSNQTAIDQLDIVGKMGTLTAFDYYLYGESYYGLGKFSDAKEAYQKAISSWPNLDAARGGEIKTLVRLNQFDQAKELCLAGLQQAKTAETKKYYQSIFEHVQQISLNPTSTIGDFQNLSPPGAGTGPVSLGVRSSE